MKLYPSDIIHEYDGVYVRVPPAFAASLDIYIHTHTRNPDDEYMNIRKYVHVYKCVSVV